MTKLKTNNFRVHAAEQLHESLFEAEDTKYYVFAGRPEAWDNEAVPPVPGDSVRETEFNIYDTMVFGKAVSQSDVAFMVPHYPWVQGQVFAQYDDHDEDLHDKNFFVTVDNTTEYHVFKCLNNNRNSPSTVPPQRTETAEDDIYYSTSDGYQWKYLYSIPLSVYRKFAVSGHVPVIENANTTGNAVPGAIDVILVEEPGSRYNSYASGYFTEIAVSGDTTVYGIDPTSSANTDFYKECAIKIVEGAGEGQQRQIAEYSVQGGFKRIWLTQPFAELPTSTSRYEITPNVRIEGDGSGCVARAIIDSTSNTVSHIEITDRGANYSYAMAEVVGNTGIITSNNSLVEANTAVLRPVLGPAGGHGSDINSELGATALGFSVTFANTEQLTIPVEGKIRQIGLIKDPMFANVELTLSNIEGSFTDEEEVFAIGANAKGISSYFNEPTAVLRLSNVFSGFAAGQVVQGAVSNAHATIDSIRISGTQKNFDTFDQRIRLDTTFNGSVPFQPGERVRQEITNAQAVVHESNTSFTALTQLRGVLNITDPESAQYLSSETAVANVNAIVSGDLVKASGKALYIENVQPVTRGPNLSETIKFIIRF